MSKNTKKDKNDDESMDLLPIFMCFGVGLGALFGYLFFGQIGIGSCFGIALGTLVGFVFRKKK